jgi:hypothetical protein
MYLKVSALVKLACLVVIVQVLIELVGRVRSIVCVTTAAAQQIQICMRSFNNGYMSAVRLAAQLTSDCVQSSLTRLAIVRKRPGLLKINAIHLVVSIIVLAAARLTALAYVRRACVAIRVIVVAERRGHIMTIQGVMERGRVIHCIEGIGALLLLGLAIGEAQAL